MDQEFETLVKQLQRLNVELPKHQQSLRRRLLMLHASRDEANPQPLPLTHRMSTITNLRKTLPVGVVVVLGVLILGWLLLSPGSAGPSDKRRLAEQIAAPEQQTPGASLANKGEAAQPHHSTSSDTNSGSATNDDAGIIVAQATTPAASNSSSEPQTEGSQTVPAPNSEDPTTPTSPQDGGEDTLPSGLIRAVEVHVQKDEAIPSGLAHSLQIHEQKIAASVR